MTVNTAVFFECGHVGGWTSQHQAHTQTLITQRKREERGVPMGRESSTMQASSSSGDWEPSGCRHNQLLLGVNDDTVRDDHLVTVCPHLPYRIDITAGQAKFQELCHCRILGNELQVGGRRQLGWHGTLESTMPNNTSGPNLCGICMQ